MITNKVRIDILNNSSLDVAVFDITKKAPYANTHQGPCRFDRKATAEVGENDSALTKNPFNSNRGSYEQREEILVRASRKILDTHQESSNNLMPYDEGGGKFPSSHTTICRCH